jgi:hypothetical protein
VTTQGGELWNIPCQSIFHDNTKREDNPRHSEIQKNKNILVKPPPFQSSRFFERLDGSVVYYESIK